MDGKHEVAAEETTSHHENARYAGLPNTREKVTRTVFLFSLFIALAAAVGNFDLNYGGTVLQMKPFNTAFGECGNFPLPTGQVVYTCRLTALQQSLVSLTSLFTAVGSLLSSVTGSYFGRRGTIQAGSILVAIGAAGMLGTSSSYLDYMVCKCIGSVGIGLNYAGAIVYGVECTPPQKRGLLLGFFSIGLGVGNAVAAGVCAGSASFTSNWAWKTPILCQIPLSVILGTGIILFPESPRWLLIKGREEQARRAVGKLMHLAPESDNVKTYIAEISAYLEFEATVAATSSWLDLFRRQNVRRTLISSLILVIPALCGTFFIIPYSAIFLAGLGIGSPFLITAIINLCIFAGSL